MKKLAFGLSFVLLGMQSAYADSCTILTANLSSGSDTSEVLALQTFLQKKGALTVTPNGYFGPNTERAVMAYQDSVGLPDDGKIFQATRDAINQENCTGIVKMIPSVDQVTAEAVKVVQPESCLDLPRNIFRGEETSDVRKLQNFLYKKGLLTAVPNGYYGVGTTQAVKDYQKSKELKQSGDTLNMMREEIKNETCLPENQTVVTNTTTNYIAGCTSALGFSVTTGMSCSTKVTFPNGCTSSTGFSTTTGMSCSGQSSGVSQTVVSTATSSTIYSTMTLKLTPNSPGLSFAQNSSHVKLATVVIQSPDAASVNGLTLIVASSSVPANTISNFTITDVGRDRVINGGPFFVFTDQSIVANVAKTYEIYGDVGLVTNPQSGALEFTGVVTLSGIGSTPTNIVIPNFTVLVGTK
jgi:peptidoglycan hydrolase-like protein with peptidoglycan-binding domain